MAPKIEKISAITFRVLNLTTEIVQEALRSGAHGYVTKTEMASQLHPAIEAVLEGGRFVLGMVDDSG
jgi:DNA-binding NarL/FixJ family response regulator